MQTNTDFLVRDQATRHTAINGAYPLSLQDTRHDSSLTDTDFHFEGNDQRLSGNPRTNNLKFRLRAGYLASDKNQSSSGAATGPKLGKISCSEKRNNPPYPSLTQAVRTNFNLSASGNNIGTGPLTLEPWQHVLLSSKKLQIIRRHSMENNLTKALSLQQEAIEHIVLSCNLSAYEHGERPLGKIKSISVHTSLAHAVKGDVPKSNHLFQEQAKSVTKTPSIPSTFFSTKSSNSAYPSLVRALRDGPLTSDTGHQTEEPFAYGAAYPSLVRALRDGPLTSDTGHQTEEPFAYGAAHPSVIQAVKNDSAASATFHQNGGGEKAVCPPLLQVLRENLTTSTTGNQSGESSSNGSKVNYISPPVSQAAIGNPPTSLIDPTTDVSSSNANDRNLVYPPHMEAFRCGPPTSPTPFIQTVGETPLVAFAGQQHLERDCTFEANNPLYYQGMQVDTDEATSKVKGAFLLPLYDLDLF